MAESVASRPTYVGYLPILFVLGFGALFAFLLPLNGFGWFIGAILGYVTSRLTLRTYFARKL